MTSHDFCHMLLLRNKSLASAAFKRRISLIFKDVNNRRQGWSRAILESTYLRNILLCRDVSCNCSMILLHYSWSPSYSKLQFVTRSPCLQPMICCHGIMWIDKKTTLVVRSPLSSIISIIMVRRVRKTFSERKNI